MRIVIVGGSGQVGHVLARNFHGKGDSVVVIARTPGSEAWRSVPWNGTDLDTWARELDGADVVINLSGRNVNCRYNSENRRSIKESRIESTRLIGRAIGQAANPPAIWMNASTATIYRHALDRPMDEADGEIGGREPDLPSSWRSSIEVATSWEQAFFDAPTPRTRKIALRSAITLSPDRDGIFDVLSRLVRSGLGGTAGSGEQFVSWIHDTDFVRAVDFLIARDDMDGAVNLSAPQPLPNRAFMRALREALGIRIGMPATEWMLEIGAIFMRTETELILKSRRVIPGRLMDAGFEFQFPKWPEAARDLVGRFRSV